MVITGNVGVEIESPLAIFNNIVLNLTQKLERIYRIPENKNMFFRNNLIFEKSSITIFGKIKVHLKQNEIYFKFSGDLTSADLNLIEITIQNQIEIKEILQYYLFMMNSIYNNLDSSICHNYIEKIHNKILKNSKQIRDEYFVIPIKNKIPELQQTDDKSLLNIFNRYSFIVRFEKETNTHFKYKIHKVLTSALNPSKSIENLRFHEIDLVQNASVELGKLQDFLVKLFYYGEILC